MARALTTAINVQAKSVLVSTSGSARLTAGGTKTQFSWASGTGANQADQVYESIGRTLAAATPETLDLYGGLTNELNEVCNFAKVKLLKIYNRSTGADCVLEVGGAASNAWETWAGAAGDKILVRPGGMLVLIAPDATAFAVTSGSADQLKINNAGSVAATYDIEIIGVKA